MERGTGVGGAFRCRGGDLAYMGGMVLCVRLSRHLRGRAFDVRGLLLSGLGPSAALPGGRWGVRGGEGEGEMRGERRRREEGREGERA